MSETTDLRPVTAIPATTSIPSTPLTSSVRISALPARAPRRGSSRSTTISAMGAGCPAHRDRTQARWRAVKAPHLVALVRAGLRAPKRRVAFVGDVRQICAALAVAVDCPGWTPPVADAQRPPHWRPQDGVPPQWRTVMAATGQGRNAGVRVSTGWWTTLTRRASVCSRGIQSDIY